MNKQISYKIVSLIFGVLVLCFAVGFYVLGWTAPTKAPPDGNVDAPLNVGAVAQYKAGGLILNTGGAENGLIVDKGNVGIGTADPGNIKLKVVGGNYGIKGEGSQWAGYFLNKNTWSGSVFLAKGGYPNDYGVYANGSKNYFEGNVGIGAMNPEAKLQIGNSLGDWSKYNEIVIGGNTAPGIRIGESETTAGYILWNPSKDLLTMGTKVSAVNYPNTLVLKNGDIGIGMMEPGQKLDVNGNIHATGDICTDQGGGKCLSEQSTGKGITTSKSWQVTCDNTCICTHSVSIENGLITKWTVSKYCQ